MRTQKLIECGYVSGEGGPLLMCDSLDARRWHGNVGGATDYDRACAFFDEHSEPPGGMIALQGSFGILWEMRGAGSAFVYQSEDRSEIYIVRSWSDNEIDDDILEIVSTTRSSVQSIGALNIVTGMVAIFWAVESGQFEPFGIVSSPFRPVGDDPALDDSALIVPTLCGQYSGEHFEVELSSRDRARVCWLRMG